MAVRYPERAGQTAAGKVYIEMLQIWSYKFGKYYRMQRLTFDVDSLILKIHR